MLRIYYNFKIKSKKSNKKNYITAFLNNEHENKSSWIFSETVQDIYVKLL